MERIGGIDLAAGLGGQLVGALSPRAAIVSSNMAYSDSSWWRQTASPDNGVSRGVRESPQRQDFIRHDRATPCRPSKGTAAYCDKPVPAPVRSLVHVKGSVFDPAFRY